MLKWHKIQKVLADGARRLVKSWGMRDKNGGEKGKNKKKIVKISTLVPPRWGFTDVGDPNYKKHISSKIKEMPMPWKWCVDSIYIILNLCMHTKKIHITRCLCSSIFTNFISMIKHSHLSTFFEIKCPSK